MFNGPIGQNLSENHRNRHFHGIIVKWSITCLNRLLTKKTLLSGNCKICTRNHISM